jgi:hypothetical protein
MVKKFLARGREVGEMPPLDHPDLMPEWAARHLGKITDRLKKGIAMAQNGGAEPPPEPVAEIDLPEVFEHEMGLEQQLSGYRREFAMLGKMREDALRKGVFHLADRYFDQQQKISNELRQLERLLPSILEQRGDYQRTAAVKSATIEFLTVLKRGLLNRGMRAGERLRAVQSDMELQRAWKEEIEAVFRECCEGRFAE